MFLGLGAGSLLFLALLLSNLRRAKTKVVQELTPNVLLTRHPLLFVTGQRSLFYFLGYWEQIPHWLASHGYEVFNLALPWQGSSRRVKHLEKFLQTQSREGAKFHLFIDSSTKAELETLLRAHNFSSIASVTHLQNGILYSESSPLTALSRPIEDLALPSVAKFSPLWTCHRLLHPQLWRLSKKNSGFLPSPALNSLILERSQFLAERDLLQG